MGKKRSVLAFLMIVGALFALSGCSFLSQAAPAISKAANAVANAYEVLNMVDAAADPWFKVKPNEAREAELRSALADCRQALTKVTVALDAAEELSAIDADALFNDFRARYKKLDQLLKETGLKSGLLFGTPTASGAPPPIPEPLALKPIS